MSCGALGELPGPLWSSFPSADSGSWQLVFIIEAYTGLAHLTVLFVLLTHPRMPPYSAPGFTVLYYVRTHILVCPLCAYVYVPGLT